MTFFSTVSSASNVDSICNILFFVFLCLIMKTSSSIDELISQKAHVFSVTDIEISLLPELKFFHCLNQTNKPTKLNSTLNQSLTGKLDPFHNVISEPKCLLQPEFKGIVVRFGEYRYLLLRRELDEKIDSTLISNST